MLANISENNENVDKQDIRFGIDIITFNFTYIYVNCRFYISPAGVDSGPFTIP